MLQYGNRRIVMEDDFKTWYRSRPPGTLDSYFNEWCDDRDTILDMEDWVKHYKYFGVHKLDGHSNFEHISSIMRDTLKFLGDQDLGYTKYPKFSGDPKDCAFKPHKSPLHMTGVFGKQEDKELFPGDVYTYWSDVAISKNSAEWEINCVRLYRMYEGKIEEYIAEFEPGLSEAEAMKAKWEGFRIAGDEWVANHMINCINLLEVRS